MHLGQIAERFGLKTDPGALAAQIEAVLADPYYAAFMESALAISDANRTGLVKDLSFFDTTFSTAAAYMRTCGRSSGSPGPPTRPSSAGFPAVTGSARRRRPIRRWWKLPLCPGGGVDNLHDFGKAGLNLLACDDHFGRVLRDFKPLQHTDRPSPGVTFTLVADGSMALALVRWLHKCLPLVPVAVAL